MKIELLGFLPDGDPTTPGAVINCTNMVPVSNGMAGAPTGVATGYAAMSASCRGLYIGKLLDGTWRTFAATASKIYEASGGSWGDQSGSTYNLQADNRWEFAQFGNVTLATNKNDTIQYTDTIGVFANVTGAPKAGHIDVSGGFVMVADTTEATYGDQSDRWWCSGIYDYTSWTPSIATQCTTGRLVDKPGRITAIKALGSNFVAYKETGIFLGQYVGSPVVWSWQMVPGDIGCASSAAVVNVGFAHYFIGRDDIYQYDGALPTSIGAPLRKWFFANLDPKYAYKIQGSIDRAKLNVWWFYPSLAGGGEIDSAIVYNIRTQKWGRASINVEMVAEYIGDGMTYDNLGTMFSTWSSLPTNVSYDSPYWTANTPVLAYTDLTHTLCTMTGQASTGTVTLNHFGDDVTYSTITRITPRWVTRPTGTLTHEYWNQSGDDVSTYATVDMYESRFDTLWSARWHQLTLNLSGDYIVNTIDVQAQQDGIA